MSSRQAARINYLNLRAAETLAQRALLIAGIPLTLVQPHFDKKIDEAWRQVTHHNTVP
jgi:hypothetical protein